MGDVGPSDRWLLEAGEILCVFLDIQVCTWEPQMKKIKGLPTPIGQVEIDDEGTLAPVHIRIP